ncbi:uncharacterized protein LOC135143417 [Zophobas morio]|uniref:uncharacterized protein LOC135143417 n=1 Tax=Zophobas morio TaxID=2755281 RepID=UPI00308388FD
MAPPMQSAIWTYFKPDDDRNKSQCIICNKTYSRKGRTTSSLKNHLKSMQPEQFSLFESSTNEKQMQKMKADAHKILTPLQEAKKQLSIEEAVQKEKKWDTKNSNSKKNDKLIGEMIALQNLSFNFVEGLGFCRLIQELSPRYNLRGRSFFTHFVCTELLTCHRIAENFDRSLIILKCETFDDRDLRDIIAEKFDTMLTEWNISKKQVHCIILHKMQLAIRSGLQSQENITVKQKCKKTSTHFNHCSKTTAKNRGQTESTASQSVSRLCNAMEHIATYLDRRYKHKFFTPVTEENIKDDILKIRTNIENDVSNSQISPNFKAAKKMKMGDSLVKDTEQPGTSGTARKPCLKSDLAMMLDSSSEDESQEISENGSPDAVLKKELLSYRNKARLNINENPLKWWSVNRSELKILYGIARRFLSPPPASVPSEELFSSAGLIYEPLRNRLEPEKAAILLFIKYNSTIFKISY